MNEIAYPLRRRMRRRQVSDLQAALGTLLDAGVIDSEASRELRVPLNAERGRGVFGPATERAVALFQQELGAENGSLLAMSPILFNAPAQAEVDLTIPREKLAPPALFTRVRTAIEPLLGGVAIEELDETGEQDDLTFLAGETGFGKQAVARFAL